jgi:hypothetical protein
MSDGVSRARSCVHSCVSVRPVVCLRASPVRLGASSCVSVRLRDSVHPISPNWGKRDSSMRLNPDIR